MGRSPIVRMRGRLHAPRVVVPSGWLLPLIMQRVHARIRGSCWLLTEVAAVCCGGAGAAGTVACVVNALTALKGPGPMLLAACARTV